MAIRKRNIPPRILRRLQEQQQQPTPSRILEQPSNLPPRILKLRQEELESQTSLKEARRTVREIPVGYHPNTPCTEFESALLQLRASMERLMMLQQEVLLQQQAVLMEQQIMIQEQQVLLEQQALMIEQLMIQEQPVLLERQAVAMEQQFRILVQQNEEEDLAKESTVDYSRLTSFMKKDDSFLTPWSWKPEEKQTMQSRPEPQYSFNGMKPPLRNLKL